MKFKYNIHSSDIFCKKQLFLSFILCDARLYLPNSVGLCVLTCCGNISSPIEILTLVRKV